MALELWMAAAEGSPWAQTGGLGDVVQALPARLAKSGVNVRRFLPGYRFIPRKEFPYEKRSAEVPLGDTKITVNFMTRKETSGIKTTLVVCDEFFGREQIYGPAGSDFPDNAKRFTLFCRAVCEYMTIADQKPDVIHAHDWPAALIPLFVRFLYAGPEQPKTVYSIHNLAYQGRFPSSELQWMALDPTIESEVFRPEGLEFYGDINFMKAALVYADHLVTVSPTYAKDILKPEHGCGLDGVLRERAHKLTGVLNGADYDSWNPSADEYIPQNYDTKHFARAREAAQRQLKKEFHVAPSKHPVIGMVGRLADQKGIDIVLDAAIPLLTLGADLCLLGDGDPALADRLMRLHKHLPGRIGVYIGFAERLSHLMMASSDIILVPSRYEPCGLTQLYAMRYGAIPIVHKTGGLGDTVIDVREDERRGTGFVFDRLTPHDLTETVRQALELKEKNHSGWEKLQIRAMTADFSWTESAKQYLSLYRRLLPHVSTGKSDVMEPTVGR